MLDARRWGLPEAEIAMLGAKLSAGPSDFPGVWPQNVAAVDAFLAGASQWRTSIRIDEGRLVTVFVGLDYGGLKVALEAAGIALTTALFAGVQALEMAARDALNGANA